MWIPVRSLSESRRSAPAGSNPPGGRYRPDPVVFIPMTISPLLRAGAPVSRMHCHAMFAGDRGEQRCDRFLGYEPGAIRYVGLAARAAPDPDGRIWVRCTRSGCGAWNLFEVVQGATGRAALRP